MTKIVGIDPGLAATGVGVVHGRGMKVAGYSFGCITTSPSSSLAARLDRIFSRLQQLFSHEMPDLVVVEDVFSLKEYPKSGIALGQVSGVILLAACRTGLTCLQIPVREAKQVLTGNGNASKVQLERAVRRHLEHPGLIRPYHASDALGLAMIGLFRCSGGKGTGATAASSSSGPSPPALSRWSPRA
ncbi:MAG: crossover junction endodeoxyribonuclease RuvC [Hyphomicrobiales bacterium]